jgi:hypothetical protein
MFRICHRRPPRTTVRDPVALTQHSQLASEGANTSTMSALGQNSVIRRCRLNVRFARKRTRLKGAQHLVLCRSLTPRRRLRPGSFQQLRQRDQHSVEKGTPVQPTLCHERNGGTEPAPCWKRVAKDRARTPNSKQPQQECCAIEATNIEPYMSSSSSS